MSIIWLKDHENLGRRFGESEIEFIEPITRHPNFALTNFLKEIVRIITFQGIFPTGTRFEVNLNATGAVVNTIKFEFTTHYRNMIQLFVVFESSSKRVVISAKF